MFRLFLRKKLLAGAENAAESPRLQASELQQAETQRRNRRVFARFSIDHKHLTLMNEQDILLVREISLKGFSTEVSPRGYERLSVGDVYEARIRYLRELYDLSARVAWKHDGFVGFALEKTTRETMLFIKRLLRPVEIANSLKLVDAAFTSTAGSGKTWFHGDEDCDLYTWHDPDTAKLCAWQLNIGHDYVEWQEADGMSSGALKPPFPQATAATDHPSIASLIGKLQALAQTRDESLDPAKKQFAIDIMMALPHPVREEILQTFTG